MSIVDTISYELWDKDPEAFADQLGKNHKRSGFCGIQDHPIPERMVSDSIEMFEEFFALSQDIKMKYFIKDIGGARGYTPYKIETAKGAKHADLKEFWQTGRSLKPEHPYAIYMFENIVAEEVPEFKTKITELFDVFDSFGQQLMQPIAMYLGLENNYFESHINEGNSVLRTIHYPPVDEDIGERSGAHGDINLITLLIGGNKPGLEILVDDNWYPIDTPQSTVVCNVGDMLERFTNNRLPSVLHRVTTPSDAVKGSSRYSIPFFLHPNPDWFIETLPSCIDDEYPDLYPEGIMADDFLQQRLYEIKLL